MKRTLATIVLALALPPAFADETTAAAFFGRLSGQWQGTGEVRRMSADMGLTWEPVLGGRFQRLALDNRMTGDDGQTWHFQAQAFYRIEPDGSIAGTWFDSRGISLPLTGNVEGEAMTIHWGTAAVEQGRSTYRFSQDWLDVTDEVLAKDGEWQVFGRMRLARRPGSGKKEAPGANAPGADSRR